MSNSHLDDELEQVITEQAERLRLAEAHIAELEANIEHDAVFNNPADVWANSEALEHRCKALEANNVLLREALEPFARFHCSPPGECECHNCQARDVLQRTPAESLAAVRREAIEQAHMAGQFSAGVDPGYSTARAYADEVLRDA